MIRSRPFKEADVRERLAEMRWDLRRRGAPPPTSSRTFCKVIDGRLRIGSDTLHRTPEARRWRTVLRMKGSHR